MAKDDSDKDQLDLKMENLDAELKMRFAEEREARIGRTAENILLSYAEKKPGEFLDVKFAQKIRQVALTLYGEPVAVDPLSGVDVAPDPE